MSRTQHGFTLIEVMMTVAIIAILGAIAYPSYRSYVLRANRAEARNALLQVQVAQEKFFLQHNRYAGNTELSTAPDDGTTPGLGIPMNTEHGSFQLGLNAPTNTTYTATATTQGSQTADTTCKQFSIDQTGNRLATNSSNANSSTCWN